MNRILFAVLAIAALSVQWGCTCGKIEPGHVGVVVPLSGNEKGQLETASNGWYTYGFNTNVYEFPVYNQQHNWTAVAAEGKINVDERMYFMDRNGLRVGADVGVQFHVPAEHVTTLFKTYRQDLDHIRDTVLKMTVRNALNVAAQSYTAEDMFGEKRAKFFADALKLVQADMSPNGLEVSNLYLNGELELPEQIRNTIQAKLQATMFAQQKVNEKLAVEAEAAKQVAAAEGAAKAQVAKAEGEARSRIVAAEAEAKSNQLISQSLTGNIFELRKLEIQASIQQAYAAKWSGAVPTTILPGQAGSPFLYDLRPK